MKQDKSNIVYRLDKGSGVAVISSLTYLKCMTFLVIATKSLSCKLDNNILYLAKIQQFFQSLIKADGIIENDDYKQPYSTSASTTAMYDLPKVH